MTIEDLIAELQNRGVILKVNGDRLLVDAPAGVLSPEIRDSLRVQKSMIVDLLRSRQNFERTGDRRALCAKRDARSVKWNEAFDTLETMKQDSPEYEESFAEWEKVDQEYRQTCDQIDYAELNERIRRQAKVRNDIS